jgi:hypothetical protein
MLEKNKQGYIPKLGYFKAKVRKLQSSLHIGQSAAKKCQKSLINNEYWGSFFP